MIHKDSKQRPVIETLYEHLPQPWIDDDGTTKYVGYASLGFGPDKPAWRIERHTTDGNVTKVEYPNGSMAMEFVWDDRATYHYGR